MSPGGIRNRNPIKTKTKSHALDRAASGIGPSLIYLNNLRMDGHVDGLGETRNIYRNSVGNDLGQRPAASGIGPSLIYLNNLRMDGHVDGLGETRNIYKKFGRKRSWATNIWKTWSHIHPLIDIRFFKSASYTTLNQI